MRQWRWFLMFVFILGAAALAATQGTRAGGNARVVTLTAKRFEFSSQEITLKKGETLRILLRSADVTHGFFSRELGFDEDIIGGETTEVTVTPKVAGKYAVICNHFCGAGHGNMKMTIVVE